MRRGYTQQDAELESKSWGRTFEDGDYPCDCGHKESQHVDWVGHCDVYECPCTRFCLGVPF
jgi:hypothetical protein